MKKIKLFAIIAIIFCAPSLSFAQNTFYGDYAGEYGTNNSNFGAAAGKNISSGLNNVHIGYQSGYYNESGRDNTVLGYQTGYSLTSGTGNVLLGKNAGYNLNNGNTNTLLGSYSGYTMEGQTGNVFIGYQAGYSETGSNKLYISNSSTNTLIYGDFSTGRVGIGTTSPSKKLDVAGDINLSGDIYKNNVLFKEGIWTYSSALRQRIYVNSVRCGIGTTDPQTGLHVHGTNFNTSTITIQRSYGFGTPSDEGSALKLLSELPSSPGTTIGSILFNVVDVNGEITSASIKSVSEPDGIVSPSYNANLTFQTTNHGNLVSRMIITSLGKVGIGTTSPGKTLDVAGDIQFSNNLYKNGNLFKEGLWDVGIGTSIYTNNSVGIGTNDPLNSFHIKGNDPDISLDINSASTANYAELKFRIDGGNQEAALMYHKTDKNLILENGGINAIVIKENGNVGIGNATPSYDSFASELVVGDYGSNPELNNNGITIVANNRSSIFFADGINNSDDQIGRITYYHYDNSLNFYTNDANRMVITSDGKVGIGTASPAERLTVDGKILAEEIEVVVDVTNYPDFVFDKDYHLISIEDVEQYINQHHHLPDVPSAANVKENGLSLGEMNVILLKKIEELTLYTIDQQKQIKELYMEIECLKEQK